MTRKQFTEESVRRLRPPQEGRAEFSDSAVAGLMLRVTSRGAKSWSVIYKVRGQGGQSPVSGRPLKGTQRRISLGCYPVVTLKEARARAIEVLQNAAEGTDARLTQNEARAIRIANTVELVGRRFIEQDAKRNVASWQKIERGLELHVYPRWGHRPIGEIRRKDVHELLDEMVAGGRVGAAQDTRKHLSRLFNWAVDREIIYNSPLHGLNRKDLRYMADAGRALTDDELRAVWRAAQQMGYPYAPLFHLLILTGQRRNEWAEAVASEICERRRVLEIPKSLYKGKRDHVVPLVPPAWEILAAVPRWSGADPFLFSTRAGQVPVAGFSKAKTQLDQLATAELRAIRNDPAAALAGYRIHDFRVTCESRLADLGLNQDVRDAVLGHAKIGLQRTYNKHDYAEEKRSALQKYSEHVMGVVGCQK
ncbi:MAG: hypothetical protein CTY20_12530 [Hyphomicrobium sp.]|nr:MAG: hypothetical protein CTY20_12530 [Hyphomicrobium sp.]